MRIDAVPENKIEIHGTGLHLRVAHESRPHIRKPIDAGASGIILDDQKADKRQAHGHGGGGFG
jgi:hypothetical protein